MKTAVKVFAALAAVFFARVSVADIQYIYLPKSYYVDGAAYQSSGYEGNGWGREGNSWVETVGGKVYSCKQQRKDVYQTSITRKQVCWGTPAVVCPQGQSLEESTGLCVVPPPVVDCSREAGKTFMAKLSQANASNYCMPAGQLVDPNGELTPSNFVSGKCDTELSGDHPLVADVATGEVMMELRYTGASCSENVAPNPDVSVPTPESPEMPKDEVCMTGSSGGTACIDPATPKNCGEFNGERVCVDDPPLGNCTFAGSNSWACDSAAPTPPKPPVPPEFTVAGRKKNGQSGTMQVFPQGAEGGDENSTYTGGGAGRDGEGSACGGEGQPPCKMDETGTPEYADGDIEDPTSGLDDVLTDVQGRSGTEAGSASDLDGVKSDIEAVLPGSGNCAPITLQWRGASTEIDGATKLAPLRQGLSWLVGLYAAISILGVLLRK